MGDGLGPDATLCTDAFVAAMRRTMPPEQAAKLDRPEVRATLAPLGEAVFDIATGPAQGRADAETDAAFWAWAAALNAWAAGMERWRAGVAEAFATIDPRDPALGRLRERLLAAPEPPRPPRDAPASLTGRVR